MFALATMGAFAQTDSTSIGAGYQEETYYSLSSGTQATNTVTDWDLAFDVSPVGYAVRINAGSGTRAWVFPGDTSQFATLDTAGMSVWTELYNADTSWYAGALNSLENGLDVGWGEYNMNTHTIHANRIFVLELSNGVFQKVMIESLASGAFTFRHATLDNSMNMQHQLIKADYANANFGYFDLKSHTNRNLEPANTQWDLYFGKYTTDLGIAYNVTGALINPDVEVAKVYPVNDPSTYNDWFNESYSDHMNAIGYDWKSFNMTTFTYDVADSTVYFVKAVDGNIYKLIFTGFEGSSTGKIHFEKSLVSTISLNENNSAELVSVYPNPATELLSVVLNGEGATELNLVNTNGAVVWSQTINTSGLTSEHINIANLPVGVYMLRIQNGGNIHVEKIIKQ